MGRLPGLRIDRTGAAIIGASLMVAVNALTPEQAYAAIHLDTIVLLFGMMIVVANLQLSGFFTLISQRVVEHARHPLLLMVSIVAVSGLFSAFFVNDTMCLVLTPLVLEITAKLQRNPVPYLLAVATASNVGSAATITGNPQNMMIGSFSGISYIHFARCLAPVALFGLCLTVLSIYLFHRVEFQGPFTRQVERRVVRVHRGLMIKSLAAAGGMIVFFFLGWPVSKVAIVTGAVLLITRRIKPERVYQRIDWSLLVLFAGLFVVIAGIEHTSLEDQLKHLAAQTGLENVYLMSALSGVLSNLVSNVPAVLVFKPFMVHLANPDRAWLTLAMSSTLAGNLTLLGSVANLIVVQQAARSQIKIGFWDYAKVGAPLTLLSTAAGAWWINWHC